ncbi:hypothetical protein BaRGS_00006552 [Batillaria attramentaria]|uniref:Uncharacterized protein n=1 Tax=Batillaria attramentaria TaxID=370345 RepID=A0ABD0LSW6_9CAEN
MRNNLISRRLPKSLKCEGCDCEIPVEVCQRGNSVIARLDRVAGDCGSGVEWSFREITKPVTPLACTQPAADSCWIEVHGISQQPLSDCNNNAVRTRSVLAGPFRYVMCPTVALRGFPGAALLPLILDKASLLLSDRFPHGVLSSGAWNSSPDLSVLW